MAQKINEGDGLTPGDDVQPGDGADRLPEAGEPLGDEERRAQRARRVITIAQVVLAVAQALDGVVRIFS